ncbi:phosphohistidine phosphatase SixA [Trichlorobacter lovleyi]|uniref:phosphohistidine phosphatase SixA n=1 Tax=Trichlorobacter lovleyi TaxID=313985 RepID=UPI0023F3CFAA|nr:phosphohistidine phosphatase SixA [Trichlorobacter lovleyi]
MVIYLVRHAEAVERSEGLDDGVRWLTRKGRKATQKAGSRLHRKRVRPDLVITSPLTRAVQTAELLMAALGERTELIADSGLAPDATLEQLIALITSRRKLGSIMLVGHEPLLGQAAALLLGREEVAGLAKGSCLCLELRDKPDKPARFLWYAPVSGKLISSAKKALVPKP